MESRPTSAAPAPNEPASTPAEDLPELYRAILDRVAELERVGSRASAGRIRAEATAAYSNAWDESARKILTGLIVRADRTLSAGDRGGSRAWSFRRRATAAR